MFGDGKACRANAGEHCYFFLGEKKHLVFFAGLFVSRSTQVSRESHDGSRGKNKISFLSGPDFPTVQRKLQCSRERDAILAFWLPTSFSDTQRERHCALKRGAQILSRRNNDVTKADKILFIIIVIKQTACFMLRTLSRP